MIKRCKTQTSIIQDPIDEQCWKFRSTQQLMD
jgi:hypothetical protein